MRPTIALLFLIVATLPSADDVIVLADFEGPEASAFEAPPLVTVVAEHAKHGAHSVRIVTAADSYPGISFQDGGVLARFRERPMFCMDIFNPMEASTGYSVRVDDAKSKDYGSRCNDDGYSAPPGWSTLRVSLSGLKRSNANNFAERESLDMSALRLFTIFVGQQADGKPHTLYFDNARLEGTGIPEIAGLRAFDFGPVGSGVYPGFTGVTEQDLYASGKGYGWKSPSNGYRVGNPDDLGGDYGRGDAFIVDLKDGAGTYVVEMCIDTFGAWGTLQAIKQRTVVLNGVTVLDEKGDGAAFVKNRYLHFENDEDEPGMDLWDRRVKPSTPVRRFEATVAADGKLKVEVHGDGVMADVLCYLCVYPKAKEADGAAFMKLLEQTRKSRFAEEIVLTLPKADHPAAKPTAVEQARGYVAFVRDADTNVAATAAPDDQERAAHLDFAGCTGEPLSAQLGLVPVKAIPALTAAVSALVGPAGATIPADAIELRIVRNFVKRNGREALLSPMILQPNHSLPLKPGFTRAIWVTVHTPADAKPGAYTGTVTLSGGGSPLSMPITLTVHPFALDQVDDVTISCTGTTAGNSRGTFPELDAKWWTTAEAMMKNQHDHGMNAVTGGPGMQLTAITGGKAEIDFTEADRWMALAVKYGLTKRGDSYQGFDINLGFQRDGGKNALAENERRAKEKWGIGFAEVLKIAYGAVMAHAKEKGWPPRSYYFLDEPRPEWGNIEECQKLIELYTSAVPDCAFSGYYSPGDGRDAYFSRMSVSVAHHTAASLKLCVDSHKEAWDYSGGGTRFDIGRWFFVLRQAGVSGFLRNGWMYGCSDPYYDFSDTEGSWAQVYPSANAAGFVSTVMWERTATGVADYRYLKTLASRIATAKAAKRDTAAAEVFLAATLKPITIESSDSANLSAADTATFRANLVKYIVALSGK